MHLIFENETKTENFRAQYKKRKLMRLMSQMCVRKYTSSINNFPRKKKTFLPKRLMMYINISLDK